MGKGYVLVQGIVHDTGWPIDGLRMRLSKWDYDPSSYHLFDWSDDQDEAVMRTFYETEVEAGICLYDSLAEFITAWKTGKWEAQGSFCIPIENVSHVERL